MAELFSETGQSKDVAVGVPNLQANFVPAIDQARFTDGFGFRIPFGGGPTTRSYLDYGVSSESSSYNTLLSDISASLLPSAGGETFNIEGLVGPQGIPGRNGLDGVTQVIYSGTPGLLALSSALQQIEALGTDVDKMIYTTGVTQYYTWANGNSVPLDKSWNFIACDSDASFILAASISAGRLYYSNNGGSTWTETYPPGGIAAGKNWQLTACDADGSNLMAGVTQGRLYTSSDSGASWVERQPAGAVNYDWRSGASNSTGSVLVAGSAGGNLYVSTDSGATWVDRSPVVNGYYYALACSNNGAVILAGDSAKRLWLSTDYGASWTEKRPDGDVNKWWWSAAVNSDGSVLVASTQYNEIFMSDDSGATWSDITPSDYAAYSFPWSVAVNSTGSMIVAVVGLEQYGGNNIGFIFVSFDYGTTWRIEYPNSTTPHAWYGVDVAANGSVIVAGASTDYTNQGGVWLSTSSGIVPTWAETTITAFARTLVDDATAAESRSTLGLGSTDDVTFNDLTLTTPSNIYALNHDSFAGFVSDEHIAHSGVSIIAGTGMSGGGDISANRTLNCTITQYTDEMVDDRVAALIQNGTGITWTYDDVANTLTGNVTVTAYTDEMAQDAIGGILDNGTVGSVIFSYDDVTPKISATIQAGEVDHNALLNTHNLTTSIDHDALTNFVAGEHFLQTAITNVSTALATGLLKVTTGTGALSVVTDSSANWDTAYTHSQVVVGNPHSVTKTEVGLGSVENTALSTWAGSANITTLGTIASGTWNATAIGISKGGTGQATAQAAIDALTQVSGATNEHVLTKDTVSGNAIFKAAPSGDNYTVKVDAGATADYIGAASSDGVLRTGAGLSYTDGGNFITLNTTEVDIETGCGVYLGTNQTINNASTTIVQLDTENFDLGADFNTGTYNWTCPATGYYLISAGATMASMADGDQVNLYIYKDGVSIGNTSLIGAAASTSIKPNFTKVFYIASGAVIDMRIYHNNGLSRTLAAGDQNTFMTIVRLTK